MNKIDLASRVAIITGGARGIGYAVAERMLKSGATAVLWDLDAEKLKEAAAALSALGTVSTDVVELTDEAAVAAATKAVVARHGKIDILVNNAGIPPSMRPVQFRSLPRAEWAPYIDVNLYGVLNCVKATIDGMCERRWGRVITISSGAGTTGLGIGVSLYAAGKGAGISFMRHLAVECARDGVTANTLALGLMQRGDDADEAGRAVTHKMAAQIPVGRLGTATDIGYACVFLASDEASWITGQTIAVNGGAVTT